MVYMTDSQKCSKGQWFKYALNRIRNSGFINYIKYQHCKTLDITVFYFSWSLNVGLDYLRVLFTLSVLEIIV